MICYCKKTIPKNGRRVTISVTTDWGKDDLRAKTDAKQIDFCSFACVAQWALDRSLAHDGVVVKEGVPT